MPWVSNNQLSEWSGMTPRTVKKRCANLETRKGTHNATLYDSKQALPALYMGDDDSRLDPTQENAKLSRERRYKTRIERMVLEGGLVPASEVVNFCYDMATAIRNKVLAIVPKLRSKYPHIDAEVLSDIDEDLREALTELADDGIPNPLRSRMSVYLSGVQAATEADDKPVG